MAESHRRLVRHVASEVLLAASLVACAQVQFEMSPYTIRDLEVVYSQQEEITFFVWRLGTDADPDMVEFELVVDGTFQTIELDEALFPAEPYACGKQLCFQYQLRGRYQLPDTRRPLRAVHRHDGEYAGSEATEHVVETTFSIQPMALGVNLSIDPGLADWFEASGVPMKRKFEWQLFDTPSAESCGSPSASPWAGVEPAVPVDHAWVEDPKCLAVRSTPADRQHSVVVEPAVPSAETYHEHQLYAPARDDAPVVYGVLFDLQVPNADRCAAVQETILARLATAFAARGDPTRLGAYLPVDGATGSTQSGCAQDPDNRYPITEMLTDALDYVDTAVADPDDARVLWIYLNNIEAAPSPAATTSLGELTAGLFDEYDLHVFTLAIASNVIMEMHPWDATIAWRPIEDENLNADIVSFAKATLPFVTMLHDWRTEVPIRDVAGAADPLYFKLCRTVPVRWGWVGVVPGVPQWDATANFATWPADNADEPYYLIDIEPQHLVPYAAYQPWKIDAVVEVCTRFCDHPFRARGGTEYDSWLEPAASGGMEICQWR